MTPTFDPAALLASPLFTAWQRAAAQSLAAAARDPRLLKLGTGLLRAQLLWARAFESAVAAAWAPLEALAHPDDGAAAQ